MVLVAIWLAAGPAPAAADPQAGPAGRAGRLLAQANAAPAVLPPADDASARTWQPLQNDGLHDPANPALKLLQQPAEALSVLPPAFEGNQVDWIAALRASAIAPRTNIFPETKVNILDLDVLMDNTAGMPIVRFPHRAHTEWLDCSNCHDRLFVAKAGANPVNMLAILEGRFCGQCHGAVSFPLTQCRRCHSVPRDPSQVGDAP